MPTLPYPNCFCKGVRILFSFPVSIYPPAACHCSCIRLLSLLQVGRSCVLWVGLWLLASVSAGCRKYSGGCREVLGWFSVWAWRSQLETMPHWAKHVVIICLNTTLFPLALSGFRSGFRSGCLACLVCLSACFGLCFFHSCKKAFMPLLSFVGIFFLLV